MFFQIIPGTMRIHLVFLCILTGAFFFSFPLSGQNYYFQQYSLDEGLPQSQVFDIEQDSRGVIWAGTNGGGLCRFNGKKFTIYTRRDGLGSNQVNSIFEDSKGNLWLGLNTGISVYDGVHFKNIYFDSLNAQGYSQFNEDKQGNIYFIGTYANRITKLYKYDGGQYQVLNEAFNELKNAGTIFNILRISDDRLFINTTGKVFELKNNRLGESTFNSMDPFRNKNFRVVYEDKRGVLWILVTDKELAIYSHQDGKSQKVNFPKEIRIDRINTVYDDSKGNFWMADTQEGKLYQSFGDINNGNYKVYSKENGLPGEIIVTITEDNEGNLWFGTSGAGLFKYGGSKFISYSKQHGLGDNFVWSIFQDSRGIYWFGTTLNGISRLTDNRIENLQKYEKEPLGLVHSLNEDINGNLMIGSQNGLWKFTGKEFQNISLDLGLPGRQISIGDILIDGEDYWIGTSGSGLFLNSNGNVIHFTREKKNLVNNFVTHIIKDHLGNFWIGTINGLSVIKDKRTLSFMPSDGLSHKNIMQLTEDRTGNIWAATYGGGVCRITLQGNDSIRTFRVDRNRGLSSDLVYSILTDRAGNIWAGCQNGVDKITLDADGNIISIRNYDKYEGFIGSENNGQSNLVDRDGNLWFGTIKGVMVYNPQVDVVNTKAPVTSITQVKLFYENIDWHSDENKNFANGVSPWTELPNELKLPHDKNHISFEFEGLSYKVPEKVRFRWRLTGVDSDWSPETSQTEAIYSNLNPGNYTFSVMACNNDGIWNSQPAVFNFRIMPPFWQTWWFRAATFTFLVTLTIIVFWLRSTMIREKQEELELLVLFKTKKLEEQKNEIQAQRDKLEQSYKNLELLSNIGREITANLTVEAIVESVYDRINGLMDASVIGLGIYDEEKKAIEFPTLINDGIRMESFTVSIDAISNFAAKCLLNNQEIYIGNYFAEYENHKGDWQPPDKERDAQSIIYVPLYRDTKALGILTIQSYQEYAFNEYHLNIIRNIGVYAKIALENARSYEKIQEQKNRLALANDDITMQKEEIEKKNLELQELNNEKSHIIGIVAHDLRNPLTSALTMTGLMKSEWEGLSEDQELYASAIEKSLLRMNEMISRLLDIRKLEERIFDLRLERINLAKLFHEVNKNLQPEINRKKIKISIQSEDLYVNLDKDYTTQIFENLLSNAIKFSPPEKSVYIRLTKDNGKARAVIKDEGPGITEEDMKKMFGKFQRLSAQPTGGEHSTGLGLSIVKKYVEAMNGKVWCESEPGKGAAFIVEFSKA
ncbi:MAG TPA: two-component regulator propeller domain-containing protein [Cyclobacteriaceae bacterium]|nr:two-component regulator propeller domain-containing protein [Cyclobacteriaceae bacterium]